MCRPTLHSCSVVQTNESLVNADHDDIFRFPYVLANSIEKLAGQVAIRTRFGVQTHTNESLVNADHDDIWFDPEGFHAKKIQWTQWQDK